MAMVFNGTTQYLQSPGSATPLDGLTEQTVMCWIKPSSDITNLQAAVFRQRGTGFGDCLWLGINGGSYNVFQTLTFAGFSINAGTPVAGKWQHIAYVFEGQGGSLYLDGVLAGSGSGSGTIPGTARPLTIAANFDDASTPSSLLAGSLEDVRIYNRVLGVNEIATIFAGRGKDGIVSGLLCRLGLNEQAPGVVPTVIPNVQGDTSLSMTVITASPTYVDGVTVPRSRTPVRLQR